MTECFKCKILVGKIVPLCLYNGIFLCGTCLSKILKLEKEEKLKQTMRFINEI